MYFPLQMPLSAPIPKPRPTSIPLPAGPIVMQHPIQKHIQQLIKTAPAPPPPAPRASPRPPPALPVPAGAGAGAPAGPGGATLPATLDLQQIYLANKQAQAQAAAAAAAAGRPPLTPLPPQEFSTAQKRKTEGQEQPSQPQGPQKKIKGEAKVVPPWEITDLTDDSDTPTAAAAAGQKTPGEEPTESFVDVTQSGAIVTKRMQKGKEVEVVELDDSDWISYGEVASTVVGLSYCQVPILPKEKVMLVRDANNEYDTNALRVVNSNRRQVGNVPSELSLVLSPLVDQKVIRLEAHIPGQPGKYTAPLAINLLGAPENEQQVLDYCNNRGFFVKTKQIMAELQRGQILLCNFQPNLRTDFF